ncbi:GntR family transcriptional regulator [Bradyrhizobium tropiciagri]|uniref:GntR family transcriptional regulator n=1 Tax=Bradyrhizobium tropiciagri TaxID=312253 RepID=UPI001BAD8601|nr:GntR family transcriptional regulator [Bradyrhizobium tropiciagri]MBR0898938.1 GntR family transcriptional regulator [Bradyrhizobium tropiciagri]
MARSLPLKEQASRAISASQALAESIVAALEEGRLAPGQRLIEADLCVRFGVGRNTVREALQRLASEGVVELSRNRGATIREITPEQAQATLELTELLAGLAARSAAQRVHEQDNSFRMRAAIDRLEAAQLKIDDKPFIKARAGFYDALLRIGRNEELQRIFPSIHIHVLRAQFHLTRAHRNQFGDFRTIARAVLAGEPLRAERAMRKHVRRIRILLKQENAREAHRD